MRRKRRKKRRKDKNKPSNIIEIKQDSITLETIKEDNYEKYALDFNLDNLHTIAINPKD